MIVVGRIIRPHHNRGQVLIAAETDFPEDRFRAGSTVWRQTGPLVVTECRMHDGKPIVGFEGFDSITAAETLRGCELRVAASELPQLEAGQYWHHDLVGCQVVTTAGDVVGDVVRVDDGSTPLLVMRDETLIPLVDSIVKQVDVAGKKIVIEPLAGLLEINRVNHSDSQ
jgi:16S rRNA processing protein RimM